MAFKLKAFSRFVTSDHRRRAPINHYVYSTPDDAATVQASGYFNDALVKNRLKVGDAITATVAVDGTPARLSLIVATIVGLVVQTNVATGGSVVTRNIRGGAFGTSATNLKDTSGAQQWSYISRDAIRRPYDIKAGDVVEFCAVTWTQERPGAAQILETMLPDAYDFALNIEYPYNNGPNPIAANLSRALTAGGQIVASYVPDGGATKKVLFYWTAPVDIPANTSIGVNLLHEWVLGRTQGATANKLIMRTGLGSNAMGRYGSYRTSSTSSLIGLNNTAMIATGFTQDVATQAGVNKGMRISGVRCLAPSDAAIIIANGNSIEQGANEGTNFSGTSGDGDGDQYGNTGWITRLCRQQNLLVSQMSRGGDRLSYRLNDGNGTSGTTNNMACRLDFAAWIAGDGKPTFVDPNPHNDVGWGFAADWVASTAYALDDCFVANGNGYLVTQAGTSGAVAPSGTGGNITDGTLKVAYIGPNDMNPAVTTYNSRSGIKWVGGYRRYRRMYEAAFPGGFKHFAVTGSPDAGSVINASSYTYDSATGLMVVTMPAGITAKMNVGSRVRLTGVSAGTTGTGLATTPVTAISGETFTIQRATGLTITGTAIIGMSWADPSFQQASSLASGYLPQASIRSWMNRFLRSQPNPVIAFAGMLDLGKATEHGAPVTPAAETGVWRAILENGLSLGAAMTSDGTHPTSFGNEDIASFMSANDNDAVAALKIPA